MEQTLHAVIGEPSNGAWLRGQGYLYLDRRWSGTQLLTMAWTVGVAIDSAAPMPNRHANCQHQYDHPPLRPCLHVVALAEPIVPRCNLRVPFNATGDGCP
jgi:hypothetical protein